LKGRGSKNNIMSTYIWKKKAGNTGEKQVKKTEKEKTVKELVPRRF